MTAARHVPSRPVSCREKDKNKIPTSKYEIAFGYLWKEWERSLKFKTQTKKEIQMNASKGNVDTISLAGQRLIGACWCHPSQALRPTSYCPFLIQPALQRTSGNVCAPSCEQIVLGTHV